MGPSHTEVWLSIRPQAKLGDLNFEVPAVEHGTPLMEPNIERGVDTERG